MKTIYWVFTDGIINRLKVTAETELSYVGLSDTGYEYLFSKEMEGDFWHSNIESAKKEVEKIFSERMERKRKVEKIFAEKMEQNNSL